MSKLVAYDGESDDESPRRRSAEDSWAPSQEGSSHGEANNLRDESSERARARRHNSDAMYFDEDSARSASSSDGSNSRAFAEPPPPKRVAQHSPSPSFRTPVTNFPQNPSQVSLVSYGGDDFQSDGEEETRLSSQRSVGGDESYQEPKPPERRSQEDSDEEERLIDLALEESKALTHVDEVSSAEMTPNSDDASPRDDDKALETVSADAAPEFANEDEIRIPPAPEADVDESLLERFEKAFKQKSAGLNLNHEIQNRQDFINPMSYALFINTFEIDEKGTNFAPNLFDPQFVIDNLYYDKIGEQQRKAVEAQTMSSAKKLQAQAKK